MNPRLFGTEIEYGCLIEDDDLAMEITPEALALRVKDYMFREMDVGMLDEHYRDWGEPPGNGGFMFNGGRLYIDMGHIEYATPECRSVRDLIVYERAMDNLIVDALDGLGLRDQASFVRNNIDHVTGATFGYHENYLMSREIDFYQRVIPALIPFLITRQIYAGAGRIGCHEEDMWDADSPRRHRRATRIDLDSPYQISQRSDHIVTEQYQWVQFSRAIINTRDEPLADSNRFRRLHLLLGDTNMSEYAHMLKIGSTAAVLQMIEAGVNFPEMDIANPIRSLRIVSRAVRSPWPIALAQGGYTSAMEIQETYLEMAERYLLGESIEMDAILREWRSALEGLSQDPELLKDRIDWVAKKWLLETFVEEEKLSWDDPWLQSVDLEYHKIDPDRSLYADLVEEGLMRELVSDREVEDAMYDAPRDTRAYGRSLIMRMLSERPIMSAVDWDTIYLETGQLVKMLDPFHTYESMRGALEDILDRQASEPSAEME